MGVLNRRQFLNRGTMAVAAAGVAAAVPGLSGLFEDGAPELVPAAETGAEGAVTSMSEPVVARVTDAGSGEVQLFFGKSSLTMQDPQLAARLVRAAR
jgi:hypothetical protein